MNRFAKLDLIPRRGRRYTTMQNAPGNTECVVVDTKRRKVSRPYSMGDAIATAEWLNDRADDQRTFKGE